MSSLLGLAWKARARMDLAAGTSPLRVWGGCGMGKENEKGRRKGKVVGREVGRSVGREGVWEGKECGKECEEKYL